MNTTPAQENLLPSARFLAGLAAILFIPIVVCFFLPAVPAWADYPGIIFHLAIFGLVSRMPAPEWGRAAGYGWLVVDTTVGVMTMHGIGEEIFAPIRFGGHIFAGIWIVSASVGGSRLLQILGVISGLYLGGFTFVSTFLPMQALAPASILVTVWLAIIAFYDGNGRKEA